MGSEREGMGEGREKCEFRLAVMDEWIRGREREKGSGGMRQETEVEGKQSGGRSDRTHVSEILSIMIS